MVNPEVIKEVINPRLKRVLQVLELGVPAEKFRLFRKILLDEFGNGLARELSEIHGRFGNQERNELGGPTSRRKDGAL
jgi:hypothetical protein